MEWNAKEYANLIKDYYLKINLLNEVKIKKSREKCELDNKVCKTNDDNKRISVLHQDEEEITKMITELTRKKEKIEEILDDLKDYIHSIE